MAVLDRFIGELEALRPQVAVESLESTTEGKDVAFEYGKAVGRLEGLRLAEALLQRLLSESEKEDSGTRRHRNSKA